MRKVLHGNSQIISLFGQSKANWEMEILPDADMAGHEMFPFCNRIYKEGYRNHGRQALSAQAHYPWGMQHPPESTIQVLSEWG
jgi:hypothetical protein